MTHYVIIVAGGSGSRMQSAVAKQFLLLAGKPILQHTIEQFLAYRAATATPLGIVLVLPDRDRATWAALCAQNRFWPDNVVTVTGGPSRFASVRNGLAAMLANVVNGSTTSGDGSTTLADDNALVAVHDGVRPFVPVELIARGFATAARAGSAVACLPAKDSVRLLSADGQRSEALDRSRLRLVQTPQTFRLSWFRQAFAVEEQPHFTDCASVLEWAGFPITLIDGADENLKITTPDDLRWAETRLRTT